MGHVELALVHEGILVRAAREGILARVAREGNLVRVDILVREDNQDI